MLLILYFVGGILVNVIKQHNKQNKEKRRKEENNKKLKLKVLN
jgi:hypothetical protein